ncbi:MAG: SURF1 family protein [Halioglobus sp.]|nr:SURF1 family protein [Halioglobus sp.]
MTRRDLRLQFYPEWRMTVFVALMTTVMVALGFWQLYRAQEKTVIQAAFAQRQAQAPVPLDALWQRPPAELAYRPVRLRGRFMDRRYFLLDNRIQGGRFGYEVLGIFRLADSDNLALVNRGWIAGDPGRRELPVVPAVPGDITLTGYVYVAPGAPYLLAEQRLAPDWPKLLQAVEMDKLLPVMAALDSGAVFPYPVRLDADAAGALSVDWPLVNISPGKHRAYAAQWFVMAAVLALFYLLRYSNIGQLLRRGVKDEC